ncbi:hypothetical protein BDV24DRAFT_134686 [Aspergillus arachidicola]|uniref:Uncharacterized protein n=1 Tax=Aspergillus arachidicola TaxID=656916 RepID=A0A5N6Y6Q9_9EURO|nr:hypothetical protein BDV24DRAFT_134686 [Aspergillus arachidicola]
MVSLPPCSPSGGRSLTQYYPIPWSVQRQQAGLPSQRQRKWPSSVYRTWSSVLLQLGPLVAPENPVTGLLPKQRGPPWQPVPVGLRAVQGMTVHYLVFVVHSVVGIHDTSELVAQQGGPRGRHQAYTLRPPASIAPRLRARKRIPHRIARVLLRSDAVPGMRRFLLVSRRKVGCNGPITEGSEDRSYSGET